MKLIRTIASVVGAAALLTGCATPTGAGSGDEDNVLTYLEPQFFRTLYPPAAGFYPNGGVVNQLTDRLLYQDPETLELSPWIATEMPKVRPHQLRVLLQLGQPPHAYPRRAGCAEALSLESGNLNKRKHS